jgi:hypothetical protein
MSRVELSSTIRDKHAVSQPHEAESQAELGARRIGNVGRGRPVCPAAHWLPDEGFSNFPQARALAERCCLAAASHLSPSASRSRR